MTTQTWNFNIDGQPHTLTLEHGVFSGKRSIMLDGYLLEYIPGSLIKLIDSGSFHEYQVQGHSLVVIIQSKIIGCTYDLLIDGISLATGEHGPERIYTSRQGAFFLAVVMFLVGLAISWSLKNNYERRLVIEEWPVVTAKVTDVTVNEHERRDDSSIYYLPYLSVEYLFADERFTSQIEDDTQAYNRSAETLAVHNVGEDLLLYVNPANPKEIVLYYEKLAPNGWIVSALIFTGLFTGLAILLFVGLWFSAKNRKTL